MAKRMEKIREAGVNELAAQQKERLPDRIGQCPTEKGPQSIALHTCKYSKQNTFRPGEFLHILQG